MTNPIRSSPATQSYRKRRTKESITSSREQLTYDLYVGMVHADFDSERRDTYEVIATEAMYAAEVLLNKMK